MSTTQYHGKIYRSKGSGRLFTKTPNGNVLYKHPVVGPFKWSVCELTVKTMNSFVRTGYLEAVDNA